MALTINQETISDEDLYEEFEAIKTHYQNLGEVVCCDRDTEFQDLAKENLINRVLLNQESVARFGLVEDEAVAAKLAELKEQHGGEEKFYENTGLEEGDDESIVNKVALSISVDRLVDAEIGEDVDPAEDDLEEFYQKNIEAYMRPEEVRASHIFVEPQDEAAAQKAFDELKEARGKVLDGADFDEIAEPFLQKEEDKVDLGFFKRGDLLNELEVIAFSMRDGETSPVINTHFGYHVLHRKGGKAAEPIPLDEIRETVVEQYLLDRREQMMSDLISELKAKATIEEFEEEEE
ncbi:MAG: peptidyl-prolyl cis-trans isomerase [Verrucomicrobiales bacterium]|nr:peptidyl-prolyl cis-trans isomerase [Verrucomicrobiales bacterium]